MAEINKIVPVPYEQWVNLRDLFVKDWPKNICPYHLIENYINWRNQDISEVTDVQICSLNGNWSDGTFYLLDHHQLFFYTLNDNCERLQTLLRLLRDEDPTRTHLGCCVYERHLAAIENNFTPNWNMQFKALTHMYYWSREKEMPLNPIDGIILKPMWSEEHAMIANSIYPFRGEHSLTLFKRLMKLNTNIGAFNINNKLVAWCFQYQSGVLNALQVVDDEKYQRRGLGSLVVRAMVQESTKKGYDTFACIVDGNHPSLNLFRKLGFQCIDRVYWLGVGPYEDN